jgi:AraC family transcriptional regulator, L-rhamnose operon transcriptional activator RhaR
LEKAEIARTRKILDELCALTQHDPGSQFGEHLGLLVQFLSIVSNHLPALTLEAPRAKIHPGVTAAIKQMDDNPSELWTLPLLAEKVGLRPDYLCRLFGEIVGISPINYLNRRRLELATGLLRHTTLPVGDVGAEVGWTDANYFARRFNEKFGVSPSQYRTRFKRIQQEKGDQS